jgi:hypothetical protein
LQDNSYKALNLCPGLDSPIAECQYVERAARHLWVKNN